MKKLPDLNTASFFCSGCSMTVKPAEGTECPVCTSIVRVAWNVMEPLPIKVHIAFALALAVFIAGIVLVLRV